MAGGSTFSISPWSLNLWPSVEAPGIRAVLAGRSLGGHVGAVVEGIGERLVEQVGRVTARVVDHVVPAVAPGLVHEVVPSSSRAPPVALGPVATARGDPRPRSDLVVEAPLDTLAVLQAEVVALDGNRRWEE
ncbi:MAG: hypothetical protein U5R31_02475 [Acidimicrobiia bacterium]|nr:hypothetical protein [Acidimicrobiia bacterium]